MTTTGTTALGCDDTASCHISTRCFQHCGRDEKRMAIFIALKALPHLAQQSYSPQTEDTIGFLRLIKLDWQLLIYTV